MNVYFIVNRRNDWPFDTPDVTVVPARNYLADAGYVDPGPARVFNLCRTDRYQGRGYYVSLVAEARGHRPMPDVKMIEDLQQSDAATLFANGPDPIEWSLASANGDLFEMDAYFGRDPTGRHDADARQLFSLTHAPLARATFARNGGERWRLQRVRLLAPSNLDANELEFAAKAAAEHLAPEGRRAPRAQKPAIAILHNRDAPDPPSNPEALKRFVAIAKQMGMHAEIITKHEIERLPEFDALFIRDTTHVNHYTYQFARRGIAEGLVVIDDPDSILKATNKVYIKELLTRHRIAVPKTLVVQRNSADEILTNLSLPCIVKQPDSEFSRGVAKIHSKEQLANTLERYFATSELVVAQEWLPTEFDWRIGVLDGRPLYVCKYLMAPGHWQVIKREPGRKVEGATIALTVGEAPQVVVDTAVRAANLIGDGLYGVDLKQVGDRCYVIEVNDNPNVDAGNEDGVLKDALYREILGVFLRRIRERGHKDE